MKLEEASRTASRWMLATGKDMPEAMFIYFSAEAFLARMDNFQHATMATIGHAKNAYPYMKKTLGYKRRIRILCLLPVCIITFV